MVGPFHYNLDGIKAQLAGFLSYCAGINDNSANYMQKQADIKQYLK